MVTNDTYNIVSSNTINRFNYLRSFEPPNDKKLLNR